MDNYEGSMSITFVFDNNDIMASCGIINKNQEINKIDDIDEIDDNNINSFIYPWMTF